MPWYDTQGKIQTWVKGEQSTVFPNSPTGLVYPGNPGIPKTLAPTRYKNFGPANWSCLFAKLQLMEYWARFLVARAKPASVPHMAFTTPQLKI